MSFIGLEDVDEEPLRSNRAQEDDYDASRRNSYTPSARRNDRPQNGRNQNGARANSYRGEEAERANGSRNANRRSNRDWYADSIYDDDSRRESTARSSRREQVAQDSDDFDFEREDRRKRKPQQERVDMDAATPARRNGEVVVFIVRDLADCRMVIMSLVANKTVVISTESLDTDMTRRVKDVLCGACCALNATITRTSQVSYLITPPSVEVRGTRRTAEHYY